MFRDMFLEIRVFELCNERPDHHEEGKQAKSSVDGEPNWTSADEWDRCVPISWSGVHRFMDRRSGVRHDAAHRNNGSEGESSCGKEKQL
jgi:hypothetical protein